MIYSISGIVEQISGEYVIIESNGIGFRLFCSINTLGKLEVGKKYKLLTFYIADRAILYGFFDENERDFFEMLLLVSGIGPKKALKILNVFSLEDLKSVIILEKIDVLSKKCGINKKSASKIILELKERLQKEKFEPNNIVSDVLEVEDVLIELGYSKKDIAYAIKHIPEDSMGFQDRLKFVLKILSKHINK